MSGPVRHEAARLSAFGRLLLERAGLEPAMAAVVAETLLEGDLLGHTTHGLALLPAYLSDLGAGRLARSGAPRVLADFPAALTWDGGRLPGPWLVSRAIEAAESRARGAGTATVVVRRSHHIGCLAAYLRPAAERGLVLMILCSDPTVASVAPHGGRRGAFSPNPIAAGWPTGGDPVMIDISQSIVALGQVKRAHARGTRMPGKWLVDAAGESTDDPAVMFQEPPGAQLPTGGDDHGHKGYALALLVEALTGGLAGHGRTDPAEGWTATVYVQVWDPAGYAGGAPFVRETSHLAEACRSTPPRPGFDSVRLPGENALKRRREQLASGVELHPSILPSLEPWARKWGVPPPEARA